MELMCVYIYVCYICVLEIYFCGEQTDENANEHQHAHVTDRVAKCKQKILEKWTYTMKVHIQANDNVN